MGFLQTNLILTNLHQTKDTFGKNLFSKFSLSRDEGTLKNRIKTFENENATEFESFPEVNSKLEHSLCTVETEVKK